MFKHEHIRQRRAGTGLTATEISSPGANQEHHDGTSH